MRTDFENSFDFEFFLRLPAITPISSFESMVFNHITKRS